MRFSDFGQRFRGGTGIGQLMRDLADADSRAANSGEDDDNPSQASAARFRLGGGNPATLPDAVAAFTRCIGEFAADRPRFADAVSRYPPPQGHAGFIDALVKLFSRRYGWPISHANIALTNGSQNAFFMIFNLLAGHTDGQLRRILLPMSPEYIGYSDVSVGAPLFTARRPDIELIGDTRFKYHLATFDEPIGEDIAGICVSRPTNPTGNVLSDDELSRLDRVATDAGVPLIIDNAYGAPFPNIIHVPASLFWHDNVVLSMSLSKIGLPAARTGIIIARPDIIDAVAEMNAVFNLSPGGMAASAFEPLIRSGDILSLSDNILQPFYRQRASDALGWFEAAFAGLDARVHEPEGAIFLWLWFPDLPISTRTLYQRLKARGVVVVPGHYFFPGLDDDWPHREQCIRVNIAGDPDEVRTGLSLIADTVRQSSLPAQ